VDQTGNPWPSPIALITLTLTLVPPHHCPSHPHPRPHPHPHPHSPTPTPTLTSLHLHLHLHLTHTLTCTCTYTYTCNSWPTQRLGSLQHAADFVRALIEGKIADGHVKLQAAFLLTVGTIDVLGRVEDIPTTWRVLRARMRCSGSTAFHDYDNAYLLAHHQHQGSNKSQHTPHHPFFQLPVSVQGNVSLGEVRKESPSSNASNASTSYGTFSSSHDPHGTSSAMHALLRTDERIHAALLLVLNPDYLLLDYPMPTWPGLFAR